jgi:iron complex outermembrane receptor protein
VLYGRAEPGGLVNVVSKQPTSVPYFAFEQTVGSYGLSRSSIETSGPLNADGTLLGRASASYYTSDSIRDYVENRLGNFTGSLSWVPNTDTRINATVNYSDNQYRTDYGVPSIGNRPANLPWSTQFNDSPDLSYAKTTLLKVDGYHRFSDTWTLSATALSVTSDTREVDVSPYRVDLGLGTAPDQTCLGTGNPLCRYYLNVRPDGRYQTDQVNANLVGIFKTGDVGQTLLLGVDHYTSKKAGTLYLQQLSSADIYNPVLGNTPALNTATAIATDLDDHSDWSSVYVQDQLSFGHGIFLTAGLRYDHTSAVYGTAGTEPNEQSFTTPRLGAVWQFAPNQSLYAQYQEGVTANNGRDTITLQALSAEKARQFEVGHKIELLDGKLNSTVALYQLTKYNRGSQVPIDVAPYFNTVTVGEARTRGLEWDVSGQVTSKLSLIASYAYTDGKVTSDPTYEGLLLPNVARNTGSLWARYTIDSQWSAGGGVFAQSQRQGDMGNTFQLPGYARFDAMLAYRFGWGKSRSTLQFNVDNLFDRKYYASSHQYSSDWIKLGDPRTYRVTLRVEY